MRLFCLMICLSMLGAVDVAAQEFSTAQAPVIAPYNPGAAPAGGPVPGQFCGLEETTFSDPDWILMTSDRIIRSSDCVAECQTGSETSWWDLAPGPPCYPENRYFKFADGVDSASAFPMNSMGVGSFDGMYVKPGIDFQLYSGSDEENPFGPMQSGPSYLSITHWQGAVCESFEPGTFFVTGGAGALGDYSININGGCKGRVLWEDGKPIKDAIVEAYYLRQIGGRTIAVAIGNTETSDDEGFFPVPDGMSRDDFPMQAGEIGFSRGVRARLVYGENTGTVTNRAITNYTQWDPLLPLTRKVTGRDEIYFPFPVVFQPGVSGQINGGSADGLRTFLTADPGSSFAISAAELRAKQGAGDQKPIPAFLFFGMPSRDVFGPYGNDDVSWGYDNSALQSAGSVNDSGTRLQLHILTRVLPALDVFNFYSGKINMSGHSLGGIISRRWVGTYGYRSTTRLNKYVTFDAVHGGTKLIANNYIPNLLNEWRMNGYDPLIGSFFNGWNAYNSIATAGNRMLLASVDETWVIVPSVSALGIGRIWEQTFFSGLEPRGDCSRSVGGWELQVPNRGHSLQNDPECYVAAGRFFAGNGACLGTPANPAGCAAATYSGPPAVLCPPPFGPPTPTAAEVVESSASAGTTDSHNVYPGSAVLASVTAVLVGDATLTLHDDVGTELTKTNLVVTEIGPGTVNESFDAMLTPTSEVRLVAGAGDALAIVTCEYPSMTLARIESDQSLYTEGDPVLLTASLVDDAGVTLVGTSGTALATVVHPDGTAVDVPLFDDGAHGDGAADDGVFGETYTDTAVGGQYGVTVVVEADLTGVTHRRTAVAPFVVTPDGATLLGGFTETLVDDDTNGLAESIALSVDADVTEVGTYDLIAQVVDDAAEVVEELRTTVEVTTVPDTVTLTLNISTESVHKENGGPLSVQNITLVDANKAVAVDSLADYDTAMYLLSQFELPAEPVLQYCSPNDGVSTGGTEVILRGLNLANVTGVFVDFSAAASFEVLGDTSIRFVTPFGACDGPSSVRVVTPWHDVTRQNMFRYICPEPAAILTQPTLGPDCIGGGDVAMIVVATGTDPLSYQWRLDGVDIVGATDSVYVIDDFGIDDQGSYTVLVSNSVGSELSTALVINDCNDNGELDQCDIENATSPDCNGNLVPDECDLSSGTSQDCNVDGIPDDCQEDCNSNGIPDDCDLSTGTSQDCNGNLIPDECDIASGLSIDCNTDGVPDDCSLASGASEDCNSNGIPDDCDIASGFSTDTNSDNIPDECAAFLRGDSNADGSIGIDDGIHILNYLVGGPVICLDASDFNDSGNVNIVDPIALFSFLFQSGSPPPAPIGACGPDPTVDGLDCFGPVPSCP